MSRELNKIRKVLQQRKKNIQKEIAAAALSKEEATKENAASNNKGGQGTLTDEKKRKDEEGDLQQKATRKKSKNKKNKTETVGADGGGESKGGGASSLVATSSTKKAENNSAGSQVVVEENRPNAATKTNDNKAQEKKSPSATSSSRSTKSEVAQLLKEVKLAEERALAAKPINFQRKRQPSNASLSNNNNPNNNNNNDSAKYDDPSTIFFRWSSLGRAKYIEPKWQFLSNMSPFPVVVDGITYPSVEHFFHVMKYIYARKQPLKTASPLDSDPVISKILAMNDPVAVKQLMGKNGAIGKTLPFDPANAHKYLPVLVEKALRCKIQQHSGIKRLLLESGDALIAERKLSHRKSTPPTESEASGLIVQWKGTWYGNNSLGELWMKLREELQTQENNDNLQKNINHIENTTTHNNQNTHASKNDNSNNSHINHKGPHPQQNHPTKIKSIPAKDATLPNGGKDPTRVPSPATRSPSKRQQPATTKTSATSTTSSAPASEVLPTASTPQAVASNEKDYQDMDSDSDSSSSSSDSEDELYDKLLQ